DGPRRGVSFWPSRRGAEQLGTAPRQVRLLLFRRRLARAHQRLLGHVADRGERVRHGGGLGGGGGGSWTKHPLYPVARTPARGAVPAAVDDDSDPLVGTSADLQGADRAALGEGSLDPWFSGISAASNGGCGHLRRGFRSGRRRPGPASRVE